MSYGNTSDEVADDFRLALGDLTVSAQRYEISALTTIAKENTEHALAISEALKSHIKQVGRSSFLVILEYLVIIYPFPCFDLVL
jgi:hypothetical protein